MTTRYEPLVRLLLAFYDPGWDRPRMERALAIAQKVIVYQKGPQAYLEQAIAGAMLHTWEQSRGAHGWKHSKGSKKDAVVASELYSRYFYRVVFLDLANGVRSTLNRKSWFDALSGACAVLLTQIRQESPRVGIPPLDVIEQPAPDSPSLFEQLVELQWVWVRPRKDYHHRLIEPIAELKRKLMEDPASTEERKAHSAAVLMEHWQHVKQSYPLQGVAYGSQAEAQEHIRTFVDLWYANYFQQRLDSDLANLSHDFPVFSEGYAFVLRKFLYQRNEGVFGGEDEESKAVTTPHVSKDRGFSSNA